MPPKCLSLNTYFDVYVTGQFRIVTHQSLFCNTVLLTRVVQPEPKQFWMIGAGAAAWRYFVARDFFQSITA